MEAVFNFRVPDEHEAGVYSNILAVWNTPYEFTFDFGVTLPPQRDANANLSVPVRVVARVKIPPTRMEDILRAMTEHLRRYETQFGPVPLPTQGTINIEIPDDISSLFPDDEDGEDDGQDG